MDCKEAIRGIGFFSILFVSLLATARILAEVWDWFDPTL